MGVMVWQDERPEKKPAPGDPCPYCGGGGWVSEGKCDFCRGSGKVRNK